jgi:hypothetical protein
MAKRGLLSLIRPSRLIRAMRIAMIGAAARDTISGIRDQKEEA